MHQIVSLLTLLLTATACAPAAKPPQPNSAPSLPATAPPAAAMAKRSPPQPGEQVSPVIAFRGGGELWRVQIENAGGYAHTVNLSWGKASQHATGALQYRAPGTAAAIVLEGALDHEDGTRALRVEITPAACTDDAAQAYTHTVRVTVAGIAPMLGCGDLAK